MKELNKKYPVELEIITPVSIGAGAEKDWVNGLDFIESAGKIYKLNLRRLFHPGSGVDVNRLLPLFESKDKKGVLRVLGNKLSDVSEAEFDVSFSSANDIKAFIKNELSNKPIVPGSSLKGAIRSILYKKLKNTYFKEYEKKERNIFGEPDKGNEFMRFIKFSDMDFDKTYLVNTKIFNLLRADNREISGGWKHGRIETSFSFKPSGFNTVYEVLIPGQKANGTIMLSNEMFRFFYEHNRCNQETIQLIDGKRSLLDIFSLFRQINNHTKEYLDKETRFFDKYHTEKVDNILDSLEAIKSRLNSLPPSACIFRMSAGSGFHSITGDWQFDDYSIDGIKNIRNRNRGCFHQQDSSKSRKVAIYKDTLSLMGFVQFRLLSENETQENERIQKEYFEKIEYIRRQEEEKKRKALERQECKNRYNDLLREAEILMEQEKQEAALAKYKEAAIIYPDGKTHEVAIEELELLLRKRSERLELEIQRQEEERQREKKQQDLINGGLIFLSEEREGKYIVKDVKGAVSRIDNWLKKSGNKYIPADQEILLIKTLIRFYKAEKSRDLKKWQVLSEGYWRSVSKVVDPERIQFIFDEVMK